MNFIKRAWLATKAKKGRTALLILVTSAILIFVLAGLTIKMLPIQLSNQQKVKLAQQLPYLLIGKR